MSNHFQFFTIAHISKVISLKHIRLSDERKKEKQPLLNEMAEIFPVSLYFISHSISLPVCN